MHIFGMLIVGLFSTTCSLSVCCLIPIADLMETVKPKYPIVLAHGLLGFDELRLAGNLFPAVQYWRGIKDAFALKGIEVFTAPVSPSGSIEQRAEQLLSGIESGVKGKEVNIIAYVPSLILLSRASNNYDLDIVWYDETYHRFEHSCLSIIRGRQDYLDV